MKLKSFFTIIFSVLLFNGYGQLELNSSGNVGIGTTPTASEKFFVEGPTILYDDDMSMILDDGEITFEHEDADETLSIREYNGEMSIIPDDTELGYLGNPSWTFYKIYGYNLYNSAGVITSSDSRLKENIRAIESPLQKIINIRGVKYDLIYNPNPKHKENKRIEMENRSKDKIGFIAQELKEVFPEVVDYDEEADKYGVYYDAMIPILLEAIKEQQSIIEDIQSEIDDLKNLVVQNDYKKGITLGVAEDENLKTPILYQNNPNPFSESTIIKYNLPEAIEKAFIIIYDMNGKQMKNITLSTWGESQVSIAAGEFDAGMYLYSLLANGQLIDTRQMVITD